MINFRGNDMRKQTNEVIKRLMKKYGFNDRTNIFEIMNTIITDAQDLADFKNAFKYPNGKRSNSEISTTFKSKEIS